MSLQEFHSCECERNVKRLVNAGVVSQASHNNQPRGPVSTTSYLHVNYVNYDVVTRKTISIRDDQEEWVQNNHLNLSSFVQEKLDELIEERES